MMPGSVSVERFPEVLGIADRLPEVVLLAAGECAEAGGRGLDFFFGGAVGALGRRGRLGARGATGVCRLGRGRRCLAEQARHDFGERRIEVGDHAIAVEGDSQGHRQASRDLITFAAGVRLESAIRVSRRGMSVR